MPDSFGNLGSRQTRSEPAPPAPKAHAQVSLPSASSALPSKKPKNAAVSFAAEAAAQQEELRRKRARPFTWSEEQKASLKKREEQHDFPSMRGRNSKADSEAAQRRHAESFTAAKLKKGSSRIGPADRASDLSSFKRVPMAEISEAEINAELQDAAKRLTDAASSAEDWKGSQLRSSLQETLQRLDDMINAGLDHASADRKRGRTHTGVKAFKAFCSDVLGISANRPLDPLTTTLAEKLEEEWMCMRFVCALVQERGITATSAAAYFSAVQGWHAREHGVKLCAGLKLERLPQMLKGLRRIIGEAPRAIRRGIAPQMLKRAMDLCLDPNSPRDANVRAALAVALQGLLRSKEYCGFDKPELVINRADLIEINEDRLVLMMHACKNMKHIGGKTCPIVIGAGGTHVDAVAEVRNMLKVDPLPKGLNENEVPLFRDPETNKPISYEYMLGQVKRLMTAIGENPDHFGTHSLRIGGATALFAEGANETVIRTMGRWSSDLHRLYVRSCFEQCEAWTRRAGSAKVSDLAGTFDEVDYY